MFKYLVKVMVFAAVPGVFAMDSLAVSAGSTVDALLVNAVTVERDEPVAVVFDPQRLNDETLPDYCLLTAQVVLDGEVVRITAQNLLCITEAQQVLEGTIEGEAFAANQAPVPFTCTLSRADACQRAVLAEELMLQFRVQNDARLQPQR